MSTYAVAKLLGLALFGLVSSRALLAQDLPSATEIPSASQTPSPPVVRYIYNEKGDPLKMMEEIAAANEVLLAKRRACLSRLEEVATKAQADKAAAHRSTSRGAKK
jgi:hypothetical protein